MASTSICKACRQVLRQKLRQSQLPAPPYLLRTASLKPPNTYRLFSTAHQLSAVQADPQSLASKTPPPPASFAIPEASEADPPGWRKVDTSSTTESIARELRKAAPGVTEPYVAYGVCEVLVKECARQADYTIPQAHEKNIDIPKTKDGEDLGVGTGWWFETLKLTPTFNTWAQITYLHMYLLTVRLRMFPAATASVWHQHLLDHFFYIAEDRMVTTHNMAARSIRNKYLKDLFVQWRGLLAGYDEGLMKGDAVLATAVWRNVFKADPEVDIRGLGEIVSYIRGVLKGLEGISDEGIGSGEVVFGNPEMERNGVMVKSAMMDSPGQLAGGTVAAGGRAKTLSDPSDIV